MQKTDVANLIAKVDDYTLIVDGTDDNLISLAYTYLFPLRKVERLARHLQKLQQKRNSAANPH